MANIISLTRCGKLKDFVVCTTFAYRMNCFQAPSTIFKGLFLALTCAVTSTLPAQAAIIDGRFCENQAFDVQWYIDNDTLFASNFIPPFDSNFDPSPLADGQSYGFFEGEDTAAPYGLAIYGSSNELVRVMHNSGEFLYQGPDFLFYRGSGFFGTVISTTQGYPLGGSASFPNVVVPSVSDIENFSWPSLTCLGEGETASSVSATNTLAVLNSTAQIVHSQLLAREASIVSGLGYDSNEFGKHNVSISVIGRYSSLGDSTDEGAGALVAAFRLHPTVRVGAFIDYARDRNTPGGISYGDALPTFGTFAVYEANADLTGASARIAAAYNDTRMSITRDASLINTEPGSGNARLESYGVTAEFGYGVRVSPAFVVLPHLGIRYTDVSRRGYSEAETNDVTSPLTYDDFSQKLTTALMGVRLHGSFGQDLELFVGLGAEYDLDRNMDEYSGTSSIPGLSTFSLASHSRPDRLRASASAGVRYGLAPDQSVSAEIDFRQQAYSTDPVVALMAKYSVGF